MFHRKFEESKCDDKLDLGLEFLRASARDYLPLGCGSELSRLHHESGLCSFNFSVHVLPFLMMRQLDDESDAVWESFSQLSV